MDVIYTESFFLQRTIFFPNRPVPFYWPFHVYFNIFFIVLFSTYIQVQIGISCNNYCSNQIWPTFSYYYYCQYTLKKLSLFQYTSHSANNRMKRRWWQFIILDVGGNPKIGKTSLNKWPFLELKKACKTYGKRVSTTWPKMCTTLCTS